jgi:FMN-dependent NADH-azoreductase
MNNKFLSLYGKRAGQFLTFQSPSPTQLAIFKVIQVTEAQHAEYISASKEQRELLLEQYRANNPQITGEKKKIVELTEAVVPAVETESANDAIQENIETMEAIESLEDKIEDVTEKLESIEAKMPVVKPRKPRKK